VLDTDSPASQAPSVGCEDFLEGIELDCVGEEAAKPDVGIIWARVKGYPWWPVRAPRRVLFMSRSSACGCRFTVGIDLHVKRGQCAVACVPLISCVMTQSRPPYAVGLYPMDFKLDH
jgi:hypothetical protein